MIALSANISGNTATITDEVLRQYDGQTITIFIGDTQNTLQNQLTALRTSTVSSWGCDAQEYISKLRSEDNVF